MPTQPDWPDRVTASVIVPIRDAALTLPEQLAALAAQDTDVEWELLLVDNGSRDESPSIIREYADRWPRVRHLVCERPGANAARNTGAEMARGAHLLYCDADDVVHPSWVGAMTASLELHDAVGGRLDNETFPPGHMPRHPDRLPVTGRFLQRAVTANFGVRRSVWSHVGGFNEEYEYGSTDTEFCWRVQLAGYELAYAPEAVVAYRHRATLASAARKSYRTGQAHVRLYRDFRDSGMPRSSWPRTIGRWGLLALRLPRALASEPYRWTWVREAAQTWGRVVGSVRLGLRYL
ncbi:glycosyltransferase family 2 protein [Janibacter sp. YB324]|uniref:glycosyltransferase family 2 protein n=1 Tax=Janibacter sp. YB324 TaxID=2761047 RepID=UPI001626A9CE|nr:glycosyltransferase family A protein [Janibacter sp. YB324]QNF93482.1 glycosyltransferase family 2 protein [Janibacter sp. YB324]